MWSAEIIFYWTLEEFLSKKSLCTVKVWDEVVGVHLLLILFAIIWCSLVHCFLNVYVKAYVFRYIVREILSPLSRGSTASPPTICLPICLDTTQHHTHFLAQPCCHTPPCKHTHIQIGSEHSPFCCALCFLTAQSPYSVHLTSQCVSHLLPFMLYLQFSRKERMWACVPFWIQHFGFVHMKNQVFGNPHNMEF